MTFTHDAPGTAARDWVAHPSHHSLPALDLDLESVNRVVVVAAHPDDESLGAAGLIARADRAGVEVVVVAATDGEASHPMSPTHSPQQLGAVRRRELEAAVQHLAPRAEVHVLGLPDGRLDQHRDELLARLVAVVGDGRRTLLVAPWRRDGHVDHDAAGRSAATAAARTGARLLEYPVWFWHWAEPDAAPWERFRVLELDQRETALKAEAQAAHVSQTSALSERPGDETLLSPTFLEHFATAQERYVVEPPQDTALDDLHADEADPWGADSRWYEIRKRDVLLAALPRRTFRHGLEIGSSTGALAADLATRCDELVVVDASDRAVAAARARLGAADGVRVLHAQVPDEWPKAPPGGFDLVVASEIGYFLSPAALDGLVERVRADLAADGVLVLCHWSHEIVGWPLDGRRVHEAFTSAGLRPVVAEYRDRDFELLILSSPTAMPDPGAAP